jgi:hypothetical protein
MVTRIAATQKLSKVLNYNEKKVAQNKAQLIHSGNFLQDPQHMTYAEKLARFTRLHELNSRSAVNTLHISINFHPDEKLSDQTLSAISDRYMQGLGMAEQPYLVYRHDDARHPHIHIVTSLIDAYGKRIKTNNMGRRLSEPTRKAIEEEFGLIRAGAKKKQVDQRLATTTRMAQVLQQVNRDYKFGSLAEYNAILRAHQIIATASKKTGALYYSELNDKGHKTGPPIMASRLPGPYRLADLQKKFADSKEQRKADIPSIRHRIDWALTQHPHSLRDLTAYLRGEKIDLVLYQRGDGKVYGLAYVDHETRTAINGGDLGKQYTAGAMLKTLPGEMGQSPSRTAKTESPDETTLDRSISQAIRALGFSAIAPLSLSTLFEFTPTQGPGQSLDEEQTKRRRRRL